jgi:hypothetical protein
MLEEFLVLLGIVMFMDVFVTFFTGKFHPKTGELIPTPWFPRWISGLLLQLALNPNLAEVSNIVYRIFQKMAQVGPVRTYRRCVAVAFPFVYLVAYLFMEYVWLPIVDYQNTLEIMSSPFS